MQHANKPQDKMDDLQSELEQGVNAFYVRCRSGCLYIQYWCVRVLKRTLCPGLAARE